jgi:hypothetical protein
MTVYADPRRNPIRTEGKHMNDLPPLPAIEPGHYRHYKGGEYEVLGVARHSETLEPMVLYRPLYNLSGMWVRPFAMFLEPVSFNGTVQARFERLGTAEPASTSQNLPVP